MRNFIIILVILVTAAGTAQAAAVGISTGTFTDTSRQRTIPYKLYAPEAAKEPAPVVIFSHGLGGSIEAAPYLGEALAENGYYAFFIQHPGSDRSIWEGNPLAAKRKLKESTKTPINMINRYEDLPFVIDELTRISSAGGPLYGKLDLDRIGMAGHSYGARSVMMAAGEHLPFGMDFKDSRIKAGLVLSPNVPERHAGKPDAEIGGLYTGIDIPLFHVTGTKDGHPFTKGFDPLTRTQPYRNITAPDQYLLVLDGAQHSTFGGGRRRQQDSDAADQQDVARGAVLFFNAYLKNEQSAQNKLRREFPRTLTSTDKFEYK